MSESDHSEPDYSVTGYCTSRVRSFAFRAQPNQSNIELEHSNRNSNGAASSSSVPDLRQCASSSSAAHSNPSVTNPRPYVGNPSPSVAHANPPSANTRPSAGNTTSRVANARALASASRAVAAIPCQLANSPPILISDSVTRTPSPLNPRQFISSSSASSSRPVASSSPASNSRNYISSNSPHNLHPDANNSSTSNQYLQVPSCSNRRPHSSTRVNKGAPRPRRRKHSNSNNDGRLVQGLHPREAIVVFDQAPARARCLRRSPQERRRTHPATPTPSAPRTPLPAILVDLTLDQALDYSTHPATAVPSAPITPLPVSVDLTFDQTLHHSNMRYIGRYSTSTGQCRIFVLRSSRVSTDIFMPLARNATELLDPSRIGMPGSEIDYTLRSVVRALILQHQSRVYGSMPDILQARQEYMSPKAIAVPVLFQDSADVEQRLTNPYGEFGSEMELLLLFSEDLRELLAKFERSGTRDARIVKEDKEGSGGAFPCEQVIREWYRVSADLVEEVEWHGGRSIEKPEAVKERDSRRAAEIDLEFTRNGSRL